MTDEELNKLRDERAELHAKSIDDCCGTSDINVATEKAFKSGFDAAAELLKPELAKLKAQFDHPISERFALLKTDRDGWKALCEKMDAALGFIHAELEEMK